MAGVAPMASFIALGCIITLIVPPAASRPPAPGAEMGGGSHSRPRAALPSRSTVPFPPRAFQLMRLSGGSGAKGVDLPLPPSQREFKVAPTPRCCVPAFERYLGPPSLP